MSKADEMFKELGYKIDANAERMVIYETNITDTQIYSCVFHNTTDARFRLKLYEQYCSLELLQAIYEKCKELRMDNRQFYTKRSSRRYY